MTVLHAVSPQVMPLPADWPANFHVTGYCFLDEGADWTPPEALGQFLADGPAPVAIGFGSMTGRDPEGTQAIMLEAVRRVGARAVLLGGWADKSSTGPGGGGAAREIAPGVLWVAAAPHDWLFPRCAALVHHGGAGTTAAGLRAGRPSVIVPHFADQPYWGRRVQALGVGPAPLPRHRLTVDALAGAMRTAMTDAGIARRASELGSRISAEDGPGTAAALIDRVLAG
jgi:sterol 3beta-glucosyltransferase